MRNRKFIIGFFALFFIFGFLAFHVDVNGDSQLWLSNPTFDSSSNWYYQYGSEGDNTDLNAEISNGTANFNILGNSGTITPIEGIINNSAKSMGWKKYQNEIFGYPDTANIDTEGIHVSHLWDDRPDQFPSVHFRKNVSTNLNMLDYEITSVNLEIIFNASVNQNVDTPNDTDWDRLGTGDYVIFYALISDIYYQEPYYVARNKTRDLGFNSINGSKIEDSYLFTFNQSVIIDALNKAFQRDPDHSNFTITLGIDIYSEDNNDGDDIDNYENLYIKTFNLSLSFQKKIDEYTTVSWNQEAPKITGNDIIINNAIFSYEYKINNSWPEIAPLTEIRFYINNKLFPQGIIKISNFQTDFQGTINFNILGYIEKNVNINVSIEIIIKDSFELNETYRISIDNVYLNLDLRIRGFNWTPIIVGLIIGIIALTSTFIAYQKYFKYPKKIRKLRKVRRKLKKGKNIKEMDFSNRKNIIKKRNQNNKNLISLVLIMIVLFSFFTHILFNSLSNYQINSYQQRNQISLSNIRNKELIKNPDFQTNAFWNFTIGDRGDGSIFNNSITNSSAKFELLGEKKNLILSAGIPNQTALSEGWKILNNSNYLPPDFTEINNFGCYVWHTLDESPASGQIRNYPSVHFKKNISILDDMSQYKITSVDLEVLVNASVDPNVDAINDTVDLDLGTEIGDWVLFYVDIIDFNNNYAYRIAENRSENLGLDEPGFDPILNITDGLLKSKSQSYLINALESVLSYDNHNFTIILGMDIYCEDNKAGSGGDSDHWNYLIFKECNLSIEYQRKIQKFTTISLNQILEELPENIELKDTTLNFQHKIENSWPTSLSPFSEIRALINGNPYIETVELSDINSSFQEAKSGGFDIRSLLLKGQKNNLSLEIYIANDFIYNETNQIYIDNVSLLVSYNFIRDPINLDPLVIGLTIGLVGLVVGIGAYQLYFKYPPTVRKIRKLRKKIKKNKSSKTITLNSHQEKINNIYQDKTELLKTPQSESEIFQKDSLTK
ncbi:MAG: hypothetical protein GF311_07645 [Candidatus Lokiarchaeota archaeon]|nr:hypothetical protein [Candidatus Lokiarchaeota archaeon]